MKRNFRKCILVALATGVIVSSTPARACCGDGAIAAAAAEVAGVKVAAVIEATGKLMVAWLELINSTIAAGFGKWIASISVQTASMRVIEEGNAAVQAQLYMTKAGAEAQTRHEPSPRLCFEAAAGAGAAVASAGSGQVSRALNDSSASRTLFMPNTMAAVGKAYDDHMAKYCSQQDADLGRCAQPADPALQNADVRADVLLSTSSYTSEQAEAARAYVQRLTNPAPTQMLPKGWEQTPQGKTFIAGQYIEQARGSVAANSLNARIAERTPIKGLGTATMMDKTDTSELELMESQVRGRFENPTWYRMIAGFSMENLWREANKIQALLVWMGLKEHQQNERLEALMAANMALMNKADSEQRQMEARRAAARAGR